MPRWRSLRRTLTHIARLFHFLINPWIRALERKEKDPNYSVKFIDFIQVHASK